MKKLELKHLAPYLPYELKITFNNGKDWNIMKCGHFAFELDNYNDIRFKPILRPPDLTKEIEVYGEKFIPRSNLIEKIKPKNMIGHDMSLDRSIDSALFCLKSDKGYDYLTHWIYQDLIKWHFDVFGLIPKGLAIDINTL